MERTEHRNLFRSLSWQWILVSYCFLVLFHLFPTCILLSPRIVNLGIMLNLDRVFKVTEFIQLATWIAIGIAVVGAFVGFRSLKPRILEPAIGSALYSLTIMLSLLPPTDAPPYFSQVGFVASMCTVGFVVGFAGAGFAALSRLRRDTNIST